jgi:nitrogen fixation NifU-like protein
MTTEPRNFWQDHSRRFLEMALRTDHHESIDQPDGYGKKTGDCSDTVEIFLRCQNDLIRHVSYRLDGCIHTNACANTVVEMATGRTIDEAWEITPEGVAAYLETLPQDHFHCAELAVGALYLALADCRQLQKKPWQKVYRR